jgi:dihydropteroate synthase
VHFSHKYLSAGMNYRIVLLKSFIRHIINNFAAEINQQKMSFRSDKITPFSGNKSLICGDNELILDKPLVMGILNLTPDSFFDGGRYTTRDAWIAQAEKMIAEGAAIIDLGAVSTRPGALEVSENEEISRLLPALEFLATRYPETVFSVDTYRSDVVKRSAEAGAGIINDISGGTFEEGFFKAVAKTGLPYILMHMQGTPATMQLNPVYENITKEVDHFFAKKSEELLISGIRQLILDPGFGFGKTIEHNYELLRNLGTFTKHGFPVLIGISRKSMIYKLLEITPDEALSATYALHLTALLNGADILRVHDVKEAVQVIKIAETYMKAME